MRTPVSVFIATLLTMVLFNTVRAELMPESFSGYIDTSTSAFAKSNNEGYLAVDTDPVTGRWVACWWGADYVAVVKCQLYAGPGTSNLLQSYNFFGTESEGINVLQVVMNKTGGFHLLYAENGSFLTRVFQVDGATLQAQQSPVFNTGFSNHSAGLADFQGGYWIAGVPDGLHWVHVFAFDANGGYTGQITWIEAPSGKSFCQATAMANGDGDILIAWIERDVNNTSCWGKGKARLYRPDGTAVTGIISFPAGGQVEFSHPQITVDGTETFVVAFQGGDDYAYVSRYSPATGMVLAPTRSVYGVNLSVGAGSPGKHFAVTNQNVTSGTGSCSVDVRLFDEGLIDPVLQRGATCINPVGTYYVSAQAVTMQADGSVLRAWLQNTQGGTSRVWVQIFHHPVIAEITGMSLLEGDAGAPPPIATATVSLSAPHPTGEPISINYYTRSDTAVENIDFTGVSGRLTIPGGQTQYAIEVPLVPENIYEDNELFDVNLDDPANVGIRVHSAKMTILNDDVSPPVENNCQATYPDKCQALQEPLPGNPADFVVTLSLTGPREKDIFVNFSTADETATAGEDYVATSGQIHFPPEATSADITIPVLGDAIGEATETFVLQLSSAADVVLAEPVMRFAITEGPACELTSPVTGTVFDHNGGAGSFDMSFTHASCQWTISGVPAWVTVTSPLSGSGDATVSYTVDSQAGVGMYPRLDSILIDIGPPVDQISYEIEQEGDPSLCNFSVNPASPSLPVEGGDVVIDVSADPVCAWEVFSNVPWISIQQPTAPVSGDGTLRFHVAANTDQPNISTPSRSNSLDSPFPVPVQQDGCSYSLPVSTGSVSQSGGQLGVAVHAPGTAPGPCQWTAQSHDPWIVIVNGHSGSGGGSVQLEMLENPSVQSRTGTVSIGDDIFTVTQPGIACQYQLAPGQLEFCADGGSRSADVQTQDGCDWQFSGEPVWLSIDNNPDGVGPETTTFSVMSNESEQARISAVYLDSAAQNNAAVLNVLQPGYLVLEQFSSATPPGDWQYIEYLDPWTVEDGWLRGIGNSGAPANPGLAMALDNSAASFCADCKVEANIRTIFVTPESTAAGILGWYQGSGNQVRLSIDEVNNALLLERIRGGSVQSTSVYADILPWQSYHLSLAVNNGFLVGSLDGVDMIQLPIAFPMNAGRFGVWVNGTRMEADEFRLLGDSAPLEMIFSGGFEAPDFSGQSVCTQ
jgi:hypothetical protein